MKNTRPKIDIIEERLSSLEEKVATLQVKQLGGDIKSGIFNGASGSPGYVEPKQEWCTCKKPDPYEFDGKNGTKCWKCDRHIQPKEDIKELRRWCGCKNDNSLSGGWCVKCEAPVKPKEYKESIKELIEQLLYTNPFWHGHHEATYMLVDKIIALIKEKI